MFIETRQRPGRLTKPSQVGHSGPKVLSRSNGWMPRGINLQPTAAMLFFPKHWQLRFTSQPAGICMKVLWTAGQHWKNAALSREYSLPPLLDERCFHAIPQPRAQSEVLISVSSANTWRRRSNCPTGLATTAWAHSAFNKKACLHADFAGSLHLPQDRILLDAISKEVMQRHHSIGLLIS